MELAAYLKRAGVMTGPLKRMTRHSELSLIKSHLLGEQISLGYKAHNNFGSAVHSRWFLKKKSKHKLTEDETKMLESMVAVWENHKIIQRLLAGCVCEKRLSTVLNGVRVGYTPDARHKTWTVDGKTTACTSFEQFLTSAIKYGYFRQGVQYTLPHKQKQHIIIGVEKKIGTPKVYIIDVFQYKEHVKYCQQELQFLLYIYKHYGTYKLKKS